MGLFTLSMAGMPAAVLPGTSLTDAVGAPATLASLAVAVLVIVGTIFVFSPSLRCLQ